MANIFISVIGLIITIILVVGIHELGHFWLARIFNIRVLRFSIGFGKILYRHTDSKGTEFVISAIPLGGYVKMLNEEEDNVPIEDLHLTYNRQHYFKKLFVISAGPLFNLLFAFIIYWGLFIVGFNSVTPIIGTVTPNGIAAKSGLKPKQEITQIDNQATPTWVSIIIKLLSHAGDADNLLVTTTENHETNTYHLNLSNWQMDELKPDPLASIGIAPFEPEIQPIIKTVETHSPADLSGLKPNDRIISINNKNISNWLELLEITSNTPNQTLHFKIERQKQILNVNVLTGVKRDFLFRQHGFLGISPKVTLPANFFRLNQYNFVDASLHAFRNVQQFTILNFIILGKILTGKISIKSLGGPISIFESAGISLNSGLISFLSFLAFLSISIGVINFIPIPGLDGGHLLFETLQWIMKKPLSMQWQLLLYRLGIIFLLVIMLQALMNDILRF